MPLTMENINSIEWAFNHKLLINFIFNNIQENIMAAKNWIYFGVFFGEV